MLAIVWMLLGNVMVHPVLDSFHRGFVDTRLPSNRLLPSVLGQIVL